MVDKEMIIHGVDVSECPNVVFGIKVRCGLKNLPMDRWLCEENPECPFKIKSEFILLNSDKTQTKPTLWQKIKKLISKGREQCKLKKQ